MEIISASLLSFWQKKGLRILFSAIISGLTIASFATSSFENPINLIKWFIIGALAGGGLHGLLLWNKVVFCVILVFVLLLFAVMIFGIKPL